MCSFLGCHSAGPSVINRAGPHHINRLGPYPQIKGMDPPPLQIKGLDPHPHPQPPPHPHPQNGLGWKVMCFWGRHISFFSRNLTPPGKTPHFGVIFGRNPFCPSAPACHLEPDTLILARFGAVRSQIVHKTKFWCPFLTQNVPGPDFSW